MRRSRRLPALRRSLLAVGLLAAVTWPGSPAGAAEATVTFQVSLPARATDWTDVAALPRFDPALGELRSIDLKVDSRLDGTMGLENLTADDASLTATVAATVAVTRPASGGTLVSLTPSSTRSEPLRAYDGVTDFDGDSGRTRNVNDSGSTTATFTGATDLALFTGLTPIVLPTTGTDASTGPGAPDAATTFTSTVNAKVTVTYTYVTDTRPPDAPTIVTGPGLFTSDPNPTFAFTAEAGATTQCQLTTPSGVGSWTPCTSPWTAHLGDGDDGLSTFSVRATDGAGNQGDAADRAFTLDRVAPVAPVFTAVPPAVTQNAKPTWAFTIDTGTTARCSLDGAPAATCASPQTPDLTAALDGPHVFAVFAVDAAGNASPPSTSTVTLDRVAPGAPTITSTPASPGNDTTPTWTFDLDVGASSATCSIDGSPFIACTSPFTANLTAVPEGLHTLAVRNSDAAGNPSEPAADTYRLDHTAPDAPSITSPPSPSKDPSPVWTIDAEASATTECRLDGGGWTTCSGSFTTTFPTGSDGVHLLSVRATDQAHNVGAEATATYVLDTTAPGPPTFTITPADPSNSDQPSWSFTVDPGSTPECSVDDGPFGPCTTATSHTADLTMALDGVHRLAVRSTDAVGNVGPTGRSPFTLDRTAPVPPTITSSPVSPGSATTVTWTYTTPVGTTTTCRIDFGVSFACPGGAVTVSFSTDGEHRFMVRSRDAAGNRSALAMSLYVLDRVAPDAPVFLAVPASPSNTSTPQWTFSMEAGASGRCSLDAGPWLACADSFSADLSGAADGAHELRVQAVDAATNAGGIATGTVVLDRTAPGAPTFTGTPDPYSADATPTWTFAVEEEDSAQCRLDDGAWTACADALTADLADALDGIHSLEVRAVDEVGNVGPAAVAAFELDRVAPGAPTVLSAPLSPGRDAEPIWTLDFEAGTSMQCMLDGVALTPCAAVLQAPLTTDGLHDLAVWAVDAAGNTSPTLATTYQLDRVAPATPVVTGPVSPNHDDLPTWGIAVDDDAVAECGFDDRPMEACGVVFRPDAALADGPHRLSVLARDAAGNSSEVAVSAYLLDTVAPAAPVFTQPADATHHAWVFAMETGARGECSIDGNPWAACSSPLALSDPSRPVHLDVRATDRAGNRSPIASAGYAPTAPAVVGPSTPPTTPGRPKAEVFAPPSLSPHDASIVPTPGPLDRDLSGPVPGALHPSRALVPPPGYAEGQNPFHGPVAQLLQSAAEKTTIPGLVILLVVGFVALQNRIDRRDPKLANAPLRHEPEYLEFR